MNTSVNPTIAILAFILSAVIFATYIISYCMRHGIPPSISASYYRLRHHLLFTLTIWAAAGLILPAGIMLSRSFTQWFIYTSAAGMFLVGAAPKMKDAHQKYIHDFGGFLTVAGSMLWVAFNHPQSLRLWWFLLVYGLYLFFRKEKFSTSNPLFFVELIAIATLYTALLLKFIQL